MDDRLQKAIDRRDDIKRQILEKIPCTEFLTPSHKVGSTQYYICPYCGSGTGQNGNHTGALVYSAKYNTFCCYACSKDPLNKKGDHTAGDVIKLMQKVLNVDYNGALKEGAKRLGLDLEGNGNGNSRQASRTTAPRTNPQPTQSPSLLANAPKDEPAADKEKKRQETEAYFKKYFAECNHRLLATQAGAPGREYIMKRGLSANICKRFNIGFDDNFIHPTVKGTDRAPKHGGQFVIIPTSKCGGMVRRIMNTGKLDKLHIKPTWLLNLQVLKNPQHAVFIVEGEFDALSLIEVGADAISLGGLGYADLLNALEAFPPLKVPLLLMLDNDKDASKGQETQKKLSAELTQRGIVHFPAMGLCPQILNGTKDANEALVKDRQLFKENVHLTMKLAEWIAEEARILDNIPGKEEFYKFADKEREL